MTTDDTQLVLCLCCGARYDESSDCPRLEKMPHSAELAARVARYLVGSGCHHPRALDVRDALIALDAQGRA
jgi:hypothetical protein